VEPQQDLVEAPPQQDPAGEALSTSIEAPTPEKYTFISLGGETQTRPSDRIDYYTYLSSDYTILYEEHIDGAYLLHTVKTRYSELYELYESASKKKSIKKDPPLPPFPSKINYWHQTTEALKTRKEELENFIEINIEVMAEEFEIMTGKKHKKEKIGNNLVVTRIFSRDRRAPHQTARSGAVGATDLAAVGAYEHTWEPIKNYLLFEYKYGERVLINADTDRKRNFYIEGHGATEHIDNGTIKSIMGDLPILDREYKREFSGEGTKERSRRHLELSEACNNANIDMVGKLDTAKEFLKDVAGTHSADVHCEKIVNEFLDEPNKHTIRELKDIINVSFYSTTVTRTLAAFDRRIFESLRGGWWEYYPRKVWEWIKKLANWCSLNLIGVEETAHGGVYCDTSNTREGDEEFEEIVTPIEQEYKEKVETTFMLSIEGKSDYYFGFYTGEDEDEEEAQNTWTDAKVWYADSLSHVQTQLYHNAVYLGQEEIGQPLTDQEFAWKFCVHSPQREGNLPHLEWVKEYPDGHFYFNFGLLRSRH
jgi:hypothetical protein